MKVVRTRMETLIPRKREVFRLVISGMLNKQVAFDPGTIDKTIKVHRKPHDGKDGCSIPCRPHLVW
jgi:FixJ family two-component response regulator